MAEGFGSSHKVQMSSDGDQWERGEGKRKGASEGVGTMAEEKETMVTCSVPRSAKSHALS